MTDNQDKKRPGVVRRNQIADQCNRLSGNANAGAFPRMNIRPTPWCAPKQAQKCEDSQNTEAVNAKGASKPA